MSATWRIAEGDCVEQMRAMAEASVDAVVCDPPYGLGFMGKEWDSSFEPADVPMRRNGAQDAVNAGAARQGGRQRAGTDYQRRMARDSRAFQKWCETWATEALRVLKPGGHLLAFGGTRTYHRFACAVEDAGFETRDTIAWLYGSGFPKSLDVGKAIDAAAGAKREAVGPGRWAGRESEADLGLVNDDAWQGGAPRTTTAPATPDAERWQGWGTALKPAHEPIVVARKPLAGTVAANVLAHGTGALNVDGCRIGTDDNLNGGGYSGERREAEGATSYAIKRGGLGEFVQPAGRWPANVVLDPEAAAMLDEQTGALPTQANRSAPTGGKSWHGQGIGGGNVENPYAGESGGASRFFYVAKASSAERNAGLDGFEPSGVHRYGAGIGEGKDPNAPSIDRNVHPTVKPIDLMRWLARLVTPPGGLILDPFAGSGTTGAAAVLEGFRFVGIEREPEYAAIARARIAWWAEHPDGVEIVKALEAERVRSKVRESGQMDLDLFAVAEEAA